MACPTCDHTMQPLSHNDEIGAWWCPRCGTLKAETDAQIPPFVPKLVERCRELEKLQPVKFGIAWPGEEWTRLGIAESIKLPEDRPQPTKES